MRPVAEAAQARRRKTAPTMRNLRAPIAIQFNAADYTLKVRSSGMPG